MSDLDLESRWVGALPLVNHFLDRLQVERLLSKTIPSTGTRTKLSTVQVLGVLLRNIVLNERLPLYTQAEWASRAEPSLIGLDPDEPLALNDDRVGRALDRLFEADRAALMTEVVLGAVRQFRIDLDQLHNDSTTITFSGEYSSADGRKFQGQPTLHVTFGFNKDHRPDLKQLLFVLTVAADGAVPVHYRALDGNTADVSTHLETWEALRKLSGRTDFLYVADCKLCSRPSMDHIDRQGGRFITVLPRTRREDRWFRKLVQTEEPAWEEALRRPNPRRKTGTEDVWKVVESKLPSKEGYRIIWVWNSLMAAQDAAARQGRIEKAWVGIEQLQTKLHGKKCRIRTREKVAEAATKILKGADAERWLEYEIQEVQEEIFRQEQQGRPGPKTRYVRKQRVRFSVTLKTRTDVIEADARCDGMFPLITNDKKLSKKEILEAYKYQPRLEKRHEQLKSVEDVMPVCLKKVTRIEALLFLYFIAMLVQALIERGIRLAMVREKIEDLPLYPEERKCRAPTAERLFAVFAPLQRHQLTQRGRLIQTFKPELTPLQSTLLSLLEVPPTAFTGRRT